MSNGRLDRLIETAELEHKVACLNGGGGNREFEASSGALQALKDARETLGSDEDPTLAEVEAHVVESVTRVKLLGMLTLLRGPKYKWLHIGDKSELKDAKPPLNGMRTEHEILESFRGTRIEVLRLFLEKYGE
ncbi:hypothetical protein HOG48_00485 [Candidatus Peregrinibacteria bacterium]|jgi:hypothetical protein|nr:hypothetical protein [Candidatus Peregrinibacteria bacterium]